MATAVLVWAYDLGVVGEAGQDRALQGPTVWDRKCHHAANETLTHDKLG